MNIQSFISKVSTLADNTMRIQFDCNETPPDTMAEVFAMKGQSGWLVFKPNPVRQEDVLDLPEVKLERGEKSPGQRLRAVMFLLWKKENTTLDFDVWYHSKMNTLIEELKLKLD